MSLLDTIGAFFTDTVTVTRHAVETFVNGVAVPDPSPTTFTVDASIQPATGMQRVIAGRSLNGTDAEGQSVDDVRVIFSAVELLTRTAATAPDTIAFEGGTWTIVRVEKWDFSGLEHWRAVMTRSSLGGAQ